MLRELLIETVSMEQVEQRACETGINLSDIHPKDLRKVDFKGDPLARPHALLIRVAEIEHENYDKKNPFDWKKAPKELARKDLDF